MSKPRYLVCVEDICSGEKLVSILNIIIEYAPNLVWYGADVLTTSCFPTYLNSSIPSKMGTTSEFISLIQSINQFLSGVFLGFETQNHREFDHFFTEDERFRDILDAYIEIRAFDTSYYEIYSNDSKLLNNIADLFSTNIEKA